MLTDGLRSQAKTPGLLADGGLASGSEKRNAVIFGNAPMGATGSDRGRPVDEVTVLTRGMLGIAIQPTISLAGGASKQQWDCVVAPSTRPAGPVFQITDFTLGAEGIEITKWLKLSAASETEQPQ